MEFRYEYPLVDSMIRIHYFMEELPGCCGIQVCCNVNFKYLVRDSSKYAINGYLYKDIPKSFTRKDRIKLYETFLNVVTARAADEMYGRVVFSDVERSLGGALSLYEMGILLKIPGARRKSFNGAHKSWVVLFQKTIKKQQVAIYD